MLDNAKTLKGYQLAAADGELGHVKEFYFDDRHWTIRYLVADTGSWLTGRQVLISPYALLDVNHVERLVSTQLTKRQIEDSPSLDTDKPVSRQFEETYFGYYGYPTYWGGPYAWGFSPQIVRDNAIWKTERESRAARTWDPCLRSTQDVSGRHVEAMDGPIGHVEDFVIEHGENETWAIRYLVVNTRNWLPGKKVLISPQWIERVSWKESKVFVSLSRESVKQSPEYVEHSQLNRDFEEKLHQHYRLKGYWIEDQDSLSGTQEHQTPPGLVLDKLNGSTS